MPHIFRTILVHLQEQLYKLYISFFVDADTSGCCVTIGRALPMATQETGVSAYSKCDVQLIKVVLKMD